MPQGAAASPGPSRRWACSPSSPIAARCNAPTARTRSSWSGRAASSPTAEWCRVLDEAAALGVLQLHLSGGEPTARADLERDRRRTRAALGLYTNLITAGVLLDERAHREPAPRPGSSTSSSASRRPSPRPPTGSAAIAAGTRRSSPWRAPIRAAGLPLTVNAVVHRQNLDQLEAMIELALELGAHRLEVAHVQYYGWALAQPRGADADARAARGRDRDRRGGARRGCAAGWRSTTSSPTTGRSGRSPAWAAGAERPQRHAAGPGACPATPRPRSPGLDFASVRERPLRWIWQESPAFQAFRGTDWLPEPCRSCAPQGDRLRRLPLPGDGAGRRCRGDRSGLRAVAAARGPVRRRPRARVGGTAAALRLPPAASRAPAEAPTRLAWPDAS